MDAAEVVDRTPALFTVGGRVFVVLKPTNRDMLAVRARMAALAKAKCVSPLDYALSHQHLAPGLLGLAVSEAVKLGSGGGVKPHPDAVWDEYDSLEGVRWRCWYHASRALPDLKPEEFEALVTEDNLFDAAEALNVALQFAALDPDAKKKAQDTGTSSPPPSPGPTSSATSPATTDGTAPPY